MAQWFDVDGNRLSLLTAGAQRLDALVAMIGEARETIRLLYYIYAQDAAGQRVHAALLGAAARGVKVSLIVDGFGSDSTSHEQFFETLRNGGVDVCAFHPRWGRRYLLRNHQKMAIADEQSAIIGGFNIAQDYFEETGETCWRDLGLIIHGKAAAHLAGYFDALQIWTKTPRATMRELIRALRKWSNPRGRTRWLLGGPARRLSPWARSVRDDMRHARHLAMVAAYFAPNPAMLRRLDAIGQRGQARIVTASKTDNPATVAAARFAYPGLLRKGVEIFEYEPSRLHTKLILIDDLVYIGSANFDMRSMFLNLEVMLRIDDAAFAAHVSEYVDGEIARSVRQELAEYTGWRTWPAKLRRGLCYFLVAVVDYNVSRRLNLGA